MKHITRRALALLLTLTMLCGMLGTTAFASGGTWSGSGTAADPYLIEDAADLEALSTNVNNGTSKYSGTYFRLTGDITVSDWKPIGPSSSKCFAGNFDGDGHTVTINGISSTYYTDTYSSYAGLFSYLTTGAVVHDVTVDGSISYAAGATGSTYVGGIAGYAYGAILVNCVNSAAITTSSTASTIYLGGIVAYTNVNTARVYNCWNTGTVSADNVADNRVGGIVGLANSGSFQYCYTATGNVYGNSYATVTECYDATTWSGVADAAAWVSAGNALAVSSGYSTVDDFWSLGSDGTPVHATCDHQHAADDTGTVTAPTCTDKGYTTYTCTVCGKAYKADHVDALGHDLKTETVDATCTENGSVTETCQRDGCGYTNTTMIPALGHEYENGYCIRCEAKEPSVKTVTIGEGTSGYSYTPYGTYWTNSLVEMIYPASAIGSAGSIEKIAFQVSAASSHSTTSVKIYMGHTSQSTFSSTTNWGAGASLTLVYEGSPTLGAALGWETLELTTPFDYNGEDNLVIAVSRTASNYNTYLKYYSTSTSNTVLYRGNDSNAAYADISDVSTSGTLQAYLPNIQLTMNVCAHENTRVVSTAAPTCTEEGYTLNHCDDCGADFKTDVVPALGHDIEGVTPVVVDPDCTTPGSETYVCKRCQEEVVVELDALGHDYGEDGLCTRCGERRLETVDDFFAGLDPACVTATYTASDWTVTTLGGEKSLKTAGSTYSTKYLTFNAQVSGTISFDYYIYGRSSNIKTYYDSVLQNTYYGSYSPTWTNYTYHMDAGKTFQIAAYYYSTSAYPAVKSITFTPDCLHPTTTPSYVEATCTEGAHTDYICDTCGAIASTVYTGEPLGHLNPVYTSNGDGATHSFTCERGDGATEACTFVDRVCIYCGQKAPSVITIGSGQSSSSSYTPYCCYYKNSLRDIIYTADEIGGAGTITQIAFKVATAAQLATTSVKIYMGHTSKDEFTSSTDWVAADGLTLVYSGAPTLAAAVGWETLELDTPFAYNGTDNLVIVVSKTAGAYSSASYFYTQTSGYTTMFRQNDSDATYADVTNVTTAAAYYHGYRPDIQLTMADEEEEPVGPGEPVTYEIGTEAELRAFAEKVAGGEYNANGKLTADIALTADWTPIGTAGHPYAGSFDGDGHTISGLHINGADTYAGLFGYVSGVTVRNLIVRGYVRSTAATGSAAAVAAHASGENTFANVGAEAIVISANTNAGYYGAGGILGFAETDSAAVFTGCYNKGTVVTRSGYAGGIVGGSNSYYANTDAGINASITLTDCYNLGSVSRTGTGGYAGGIIGYSYDAVLTNCYNLGAVSDGCGELAGNITEGTVGTNCYTSADAAELTAARLGSGYKDGIGTSAPALIWETAAYAAPVSLTGITLTSLPDKTSYTTTESFDPTGMVVTANYSDGSSLTVSDYTWSPEGQLTEDTTAVTIRYNDYRTVVDDVTAEVEVTVTQVIHTVTFVCDEGVYLYVGSGGPGYEIIGSDSRPSGVKVYDGYSLLLLARAESGYTVGSVSANVDGLYVEQDGAGNNYYKIDSVTGDVIITVTAAAADASFPGSGSGTESDPYLIRNESDLRLLAAKVNSGTDYYGVFFEMTADIELTGAWTPIGTGAYYSTTAFKGSFDGGGHTVSGLSLLMDDAANSCGYGLFGLVNGAVIRNLAVSGEVTNATDDTDAGYKSYFGGIVGVAYNGVTLENCASHVDVTNRYYKNSNASTSQLEESYVGGLIGYSTGGTLTITNCYSDGAVTNQNTSGTYGAGELSTYSWVGGLVGGFYNYGDTASAITNSFAYGAVTGGHPSHNGAIIGYNGNSYGSVTVTDCYYLSGIAGDTTGSAATSAGDFLTLAAVLNANAGSALFANGSLHPVFRWETGTGTVPPAVTPDTSWYSEEAESFTITTEAQLLGFAALVNQGTSFAGKTVILGGDIALTVDWTPAGSYPDKPFSGTFQGGGHTVSGLVVDRKSTQDYNGLFGYIENATVEKLIVSGFVTGGNYTAGIAGRALNSVIRYCGNEAAVSGSGYVGGIAGYISGTRILACYNKSDVTNSKLTDAFTGGIAGNLMSNSSILASYNTGAITGAETNDDYCYTGGIAGMSWSCFIANSYNAGTVTSSKPYTGGVLGSGNLYYQQSGFNYYLEGTAAAGAGTGSDSAEYISPVSAEDLRSAGSSAVINLGSAYAAPAEGINSGYPTLKWESDPGYQYEYITEIRTRADMYEFANNVKMGHDYAGETVRLMNDIDLLGVYNSADDSAANVWTAIGDANGTVFAGTFDGQGHTVRNMVILNDQSGYLGLFSVLAEGAVVKNLAVTGLIDCASCSVGSIVGWNLGTVENCLSDVDINVRSCQYVGGIVADNAGTVRNCINNGTVNGGSASSYVGGIAGHMEPAYDGTTYQAATRPVLANCVNTGAVTGYRYVGGIVGSLFNDSDNYYIPDLSNCYNAGAVTGSYRDLYGNDPYTGVIAGKTVTGLVNCYYELDAYITGLPLAGDISGEDYTRPVSADYARLAAFAEELGGFFRYDGTSGSFVLVPAEEG